MIRRRAGVRLGLKVGVAGVLLAAGMTAVPAPAPALGLARLDPLLTSVLASGSTAPVSFVAVLDRVPLASDLTSALGLGFEGRKMAALPMLALRGLPAQIAALRLLPHVKSLWLNHGLELALHESVALIQADKVWAAPIGVTGRGVGVAVIDSGIDGTHPDVHFPEKTIANVKILGDQHLADPTYVVDGLPDTDLTVGHGTHVAGIIAGTGAASGGYFTGVAPGADLIGVGAADGTDMLTALAGYDWVLTHRAQYHIKVINNSWADGTITYDPADPLNQASLAAHDAGITVVFAAGNDGQASGNVFNRYAWPSWVLSTGGGTKLGTLGDYSSMGDDLHHPDVIAPGSFIASARAVTGVVTDANSSPLDLTDPANPRVIPLQWTQYYTAAIGTSMAAPHVAGVVALMLEANPALTPDQVRSIVASTANPMPGCPVAACGSGYVNALAAVQAALAARNRAPVAQLALVGGGSSAAGASPLAVTLSAAGTSDPDGDAIASYRWDVDGDSAVDVTTTAPTLAWSYPSGVWHPTVAAVDARGMASLPAGGVEIRTSNPPHAVASAPSKGKAGDVIAIDASGSADDGQITYTFRFGDGTVVASATPTASHVYAVDHPTTFAWSVTVTDDNGLTDGVSGTVKITP